MPYKTQADKAAHNAKRYLKKKDADTKTVYFPMRLPESLVAAASRMAAEGLLIGKHPWKTTPDVLKAMIGKGFKAYREEDSDDTSLSNVLERLENEAQLNELSRDRRTATNLVAKAKIEIGAMIEIKAQTQALQVYSTLYDNVDRMSKTTWTVWLVSELERSFPALHALHDAGHVPSVSLKRKRSGQDRRTREQQERRRPHRPR